MSATARLMQARFASTCQACGLTIRKGSDIRYVKGLPATHEGCGDPTGEPLPTRSRASRYAPRGYSTFSARCTHEDYPCCGCGQ